MKRPVAVALVLVPVCLFGGTGTTAQEMYRSCRCILEGGESLGDGLYLIDPDGPGGNEPFVVFCDMTVDGGGWTLAVNSVPGNEPPTNDITANTGAVTGLNSGHTRDLAILAVDGDAEIRHVLLGHPVYGNFDAKYTGRYHDPLPLSGDWTALYGHTAGAEAMLNDHFGMYWTSESEDHDLSPENCAITNGAPWYYRDCWFSIPSLPVDGLSQGPASSNPSVILNRYSIFVRELDFPCQATDVPAGQRLRATWGPMKHIFASPDE